MAVHKIMKDEQYLEIVNDYMPFVVSETIFQTVKTGTSFNDLWASLSAKLNFRLPDFIFFLVVDKKNGIISIILNKDAWARNWFRNIKQRSELEQVKVVGYKFKDETAKHIYEFSKL